MLTPKFLNVTFLILFFLCALSCDSRYDGKGGKLVTSPETDETSGPPDSPDPPDDPGHTGSSNDTLYIYCIDVGQGDATLIVSPSGQTVLIDAGNNGKGKSEVVPFLRSLGITSLDFIIATHYHSDHIGGIDEVIDSLSLDSLGTVYDRGWSYTTATYDDYVATAGVRRTAIEDNQVIPLGPEIYLKCVAVNGNDSLDEPFTQPPHDENDLCVALTVNYGDFDFFVAGDLSGSDSGGYTDIETGLAPEVGEVDVFQVNHHGSKFSNNQCFVNTLQPTVSVISVGSNSYGHPDPSVVARLEAVSEKVYQTEDADGNVIDGDITIKVDCTNFWVNGDAYGCTWVPWNRGGVGGALSFLTKFKPCSCQPKERPFPTLSPSLV